MIWILILSLYAGPFSKGDSVSVTTQEFLSQATCETAGRASNALVEGTYKSYKYICVKK